MITLPPCASSSHAAWRGVIKFAKKLGVLFPKQGLDFSISPDSKLDSLAVGIKTGAECPFGVGHFAPQPRNRFAPAFAKELTAELMMAKRQEFEDLGIVVEHFLKMRHERTNAAFTSRLPICLRIIALVRDNGAEVEEHFEVAAVARFAAGQMEADRIAVEIGLEMDLG